MSAATTSPEQLGKSRPGHRMAVLLVCATLPLIFVGGLVTSTDAGMAVPDWPNTYGYNLFLYPWQTWLLGPWDLFVEHGHRLMGAAVGLITLFVWRNVRRDTRPWVRVLGSMLVVFVVAQGILGGLRVVFSDQQMARIHGCTAPLFFGMAVCGMTVTSRNWFAAVEGNPGPSTHDCRVTRIRLAAVTGLAAAMCYVQIVTGAFVRHLPAGTTMGAFQTALTFHLVFAGLLVAVTAWHFWLSLRGRLAPVVSGKSGLLLLVLVILQADLGGVSWVVNYGWPRWSSYYAWTEGFVIVNSSWLQSVLTTAHVANASIIFGLLVHLFVRLVGMPTGTSPASTTTSATTLIVHEPQRPIVSDGGANSAVLKELVGQAGS